MRRGEVEDAPNMVTSTFSIKAQLVDVTPLSLRIRGIIDFYNSGAKFTEFHLKTNHNLG